MDNRDELFAPETVDEQVEQLLASHTQHPVPGAQTIHGLQQMYAEDEESLGHVWERLSEHVLDVQQKKTLIDIRSYQKERSQHMYSHDSLYPKRTTAQRLSLLFAGVAAALIVGSLLAIFTIARQAKHSMQTRSGGSSQIATKSSTYIGTQTSILRIDNGSGKIAWKYVVSQESDPGKWAFTALAVQDNTVYAISESDQEAFALDAHTGTRLWLHKFGGASVLEPPFIDNGLLYVVDAGGRIVYGIAPTDGTIKTSYQIPPTTSTVDLPAEFRMTVANHVCYVYSQEDLYVLNLAEGKQLWHFHTDARQRSIDAVTVNDGQAYLLLTDEPSQGSPTYTSHVVALKAATGEQVWKADEPVTTLSSAIVDGNVLYVFGNTGSMSALDTTSGKTIWHKFVPRSPGVLSPFVKDGKLYVTTRGDYGDLQLLSMTEKDGGNVHVLRQGADPLAQSDKLSLVGPDGVIYTGWSDTISELKDDGVVVWHTNVGGYITDLVVQL